MNFSLKSLVSQSSKNVSWIDTHCINFFIHPLTIKYEMSAIPVRIPTDKLERIDYLVKIGRFKNRSEALKFLISKSLDKEEISMLEHDVDMDKINGLLSKIGRKKNLLVIESEKTAVELVSEGRSR